MLVDPNDPPTKTNAYYGETPGLPYVPSRSFPPAPPDLATFHQQNQAINQYQDAMVMNQINAINQHTLNQQQAIFNQPNQPNIGGQNIAMVGDVINIATNLAGGGNTGLSGQSDPYCCGLLSLCCLN